MPMTVVTLTKVPLSLRGDLTKWMQEIATGVYVGNVNARVREKLWDRITQNVKQGQATISYHTNTELGYNCETYHTYRKIIDCEGIPLVQIPNSEHQNVEIKSGFSKTAKFHKVASIKKAQVKKQSESPEYVVFDIETNGLDAQSDDIIEIGAIKYNSGKQIKFDYLVNVNSAIPPKITDLTGIDNDLLNAKGHDLSEVMHRFIDFIGGDVLVGYNVNFDISFINKTLNQLGFDSMNNNYIDLLPLVKREKMFIDSYKLSDVLLSYNINDKIFHRALSDSASTLKLANKVNGFVKKLNLKS